MKISIKNWSKFQHYQNRRPPWIKLHRELLENRQWFQCSQGASKLLVELWLVASDNEDGTIDHELGDLAFRLRRENSTMQSLLQELADQGFIEIDEGSASTTLADSLQGACLETEGETETKTKAEKKRVPAYTKEFGEVWNLHRRGPKAKAVTEYKKAISSDVSHQEIVEGIIRYVSAFDENFKGSHLFRWIADSRWEEDTGVKTVKRNPVLINWSPPALVGESNEN